MRAPKHLWSGDWRRDSADAAEELSRRRARDEAVDQNRAHALPPRPSLTNRAVAWLQRRSAAARLQGRRAVAWLRSRRTHRVRAAVVIVLVGLLSAAAAFAAVTELTGSSGSGSAPAGQSHAWLGVDTVSFPFGRASLGSGGGGLAPQSGGGGFGFPLGGVMISSVVPGSPAAAAGLHPGYVLTQIGGRQVATPQALASAIAGMHAGERVRIQFYAGPLAYTAQLTLAARPKGYP
jgi:hypothetical protein